MGRNEEIEAKERERGKKKKKIIKITMIDEMAAK